MPPGKSNHRRHTPQATVHVSSPVSSVPSPVVQRVQSELGKVHDEVLQRILNVLAPRIDWLVHNRTAQEIAALRLFKIQPKHEVWNLVIKQGTTPRIAPPGLKAVSGVTWVKHQVAKEQVDLFHNTARRVMGGGQDESMDAVFKQWAEDTKADKEWSTGSNKLLVDYYMSSDARTRKGIREHYEAEKAKAAAYKGYGTLADLLREKKVDATKSAKVETTLGEQLKAADVEVDKIKASGDESKVNEAIEKRQVIAEKLVKARITAVGKEAEIAAWENYTTLTREGARAPFLGKDGSTGKAIDKRTWADKGSLAYTPYFTEDGKLCVPDNRAPSDLVGKTYTKNKSNNRWYCVLDTGQSGTNINKGKDLYKLETLKKDSVISLPLGVMPVGWSPDNASLRSHMQPYAVQKGSNIKIDENAKGWASGIPGWGSEANLDAFRDPFERYTLSAPVGIIKKDGTAASVRLYCDPGAAYAKDASGRYYCPVMNPSTSNVNNKDDADSKGVYKKANESDDSLQVVRSRQYAWMPVGFEPIVKETVDQEDAGKDADYTGGRLQWTTTAPTPATTAPEPAKAQKTVTFAPGVEEMAMAMIKALQSLKQKGIDEPTPEQVQNEIEELAADGVK